MVVNGKGALDRSPAAVASTQTVSRHDRRVALPRFTMLIKKVISD